MATMIRGGYLKQTGAHIKFISAEPLLSPLSNLNLQGIDWLIVGEELRAWKPPDARGMGDGIKIKVRRI